MSRSPFYQPYAQQPFEQWPIMSKSLWMKHFDQINIAGIALKDATRVALQAETSRDFRGTLRGFAVGLSTGTSGSRGVFVASAAERARWAGVMLAKLLGPFKWKPLRVALFLRANNALYETLGKGPIRFQFFDLLRPFRELMRDLEAFAPTVLVAPPHVLATAARASELRIRPSRVISVAEVLDAIDRQAIERGFGVRVEQIYQATEGFLGTTCAHGALHLNEEYVLFEREWLDTARTRFVPVITDLYRVTQPVIRYRLDDVLVPRESPCPCGSPLLAIDRIEGRESDVLWLPAAQGANAGPGATTMPGAAAVPVFGDVIARVLVRTLPDLVDYSVDEVESSRWHVGLAPSPEAGHSTLLRQAIQAMAVCLGASPPEVVIGAPRSESGCKLRRIRGMGAVCRPS
jgi:putative adenylate-forming enzyme